MGWFITNNKTDRQDLVDIQQETIDFLNEYVLKPCVKRYLESAKLLEIENNYTIFMESENFLIPERPFRYLNDFIAFSFRRINIDCQKDIFDNNFSFKSKVINSWREFNIELCKVFINEMELLRNLIKVIYYSFHHSNEDTNAEQTFQDSYDYIMWYLFHFLPVPLNSTFAKNKKELFSKYEMNTEIYHSYFSSKKLQHPEINDNPSISLKRFLEEEDNINLEKD